MPWLHVVVLLLFSSWVSGLLLCLSFSLSLLCLLLLLSSSVSLLRTMALTESPVRQNFPQLGFGLLFSVLLGCLSWTEDPAPAEAAWLFSVLVLCLLPLCLLSLLSLVVSLAV